MICRPGVGCGVAALAAAVVVSACGGGGGGDNGEASKSPQQILADVRAALASVHSFHFGGAEVEPGGRAEVFGDVALPGKLHATLRQGSQTLELIYVGGKAYFKANAAFWTANGNPQAAGLFADRWVHVPAAQTSALASLTDITDPAKLPDCLVGGPHGTLSRQGTDTVGGQPAVVLVDADRVPGGAPGKLWVATTGAPVPLRAMQTGPAEPGGSPRPCHEETNGSTTTGSDLTFSAYGAPVAITAPADAIDLSTLSG